MVFQKDQMPWNKGLTKETDERVRCQSEKMMGHSTSEETRGEIAKGNRVKKHSEEWKKKRSMEMMGNQHARGHTSWCAGTHIQSNTGRTHFKKGRAPWNKGKHGIYSEETLRKMSERTKEQRANPENHPNWLGGKSFEPYTPEFNERLKEQIRERDGHICQECGVPQEELGYKLHVHHIDYDKRNNNPSNLVALCCSCNSKANFNREGWMEHFGNNN